MNKKKAIVCTLLLAVVLVGVIVGAMSAETYFGFNLFNIISGGIFFIWLGGKVKEFYDWLQEE